MSWIAVDEDWQGFIYKNKPTRVIGQFQDNGGEYASITYDAIGLLIGKELTWNDEPIEVGIM